MKTLDGKTPAMMLEEVYNKISRSMFHKSGELDGIQSYHGYIKLIEVNGTKTTIGFNVGLHNCVHIFLVFGKSLSDITNNTMPDILFILQIIKGGELDARIEPLTNGRKIKLSAMSKDEYVVYQLIQDEIYHMCNPTAHDKIIG